MAAKKFGIQDIQELDEGRVAAQVNKLLTAATNDCMNRPGVDGARKITITVSLNPIVEEGGVCEEVALEVQSKIAVPSMISKSFSMGVHASQGLFHNPASPNNIHQSTIDEIGSE